MKKEILISSAMLVSALGSQAQAAEDKYVIVPIEDSLALFVTAPGSNLEAIDALKANHIDARPHDVENDRIIQPLPETEKTRKFAERVGEILGSSTSVVVIDIQTARLSTQEGF